MIGLRDLDAHAVGISEIANAPRFHEISGEPLPQPPINSFTLEQMIGAAEVVAVIIAALLGALVMWLIARRQITRKAISYSVDVDSPFAVSSGLRDAGFIFSVNDKVINNLSIALIDIVNTGNSAISKPPIEIRIPVGNSVIGAYLEDVPGGYESIWATESVTDRSCKFSIDHINPGQRIKIRVFIDGTADQCPEVICPMPDVTIRENSSVHINPIILASFEVVAPNLAAVIKIARK